MLSEVRISCAHIEQVTVVDVQLMMTRMGLIPGSLLPVLWLLAAGDLCPNSMGDCGAGCCVPLALAAPHGSRLPIQSSDGSFQKAARSWTRRPWVQSGSDGFLPFVAARSSKLPVYSKAGALFPLSDVSLRLARSWQFYWRTALEPRAPSAVS